MKLCPKCDFIYEDDQNLCDMDGEALVCDNRLGISTRTIPTVTVTGARLTKTHLRSMVMAVVAGLVFPTLLCLAYYSSSTLLYSTFASRSAKPEASDTIRQQQHIVPPQDNSVSSPVTNPSQSPTNSELASEPVSNGTEELKDRPASLPAQTQVVTTAGDNTLKAGDKRLAITRGLPPLPRLAPLPRLSLPSRLPVTKAGTRVPGSSTPPKRELTNQKLGVTNQKALVVEVKPAPGNPNKPSRVKAFFKKTGHILKRPFQF